MNKNKKDIKLKTGPVPRAKHYGYAFLRTGEMPQEKAHLVKYLSGLREGLIQDLGPKESDLTTAQKLLVERLISKVGFLRLIEEYAMSQGLFQGNRLLPVIERNYIGIDTAIQRNLSLLGIGTKRQSEGRTLEAVVEELEAKKQKKNNNKEK